VRDTSSSPAACLARCLPERAPYPEALRVCLLDASQTRPLSMSGTPCRKLGRCAGYPVVLRDSSAALSASLDRRNELRLQRCESAARREPDPLSPSSAPSTPERSSTPETTTSTPTVRASSTLGWTQACDSLRLHSLELSPAFPCRAPSSVSRLLADSRYAWPPGLFLQLKVGRQDNP
jgi:hypothetical protein